MNDIEYCSSERLLAWALKDLGAPSKDKLDPIDVHLALGYARYGLPDGSRSPSGVTIRPGKKTILDALHKAVSSLIARDEAKLQAISLGFAKLPTLDACIYSNLAGAHAIVLNAGIFAGLFSANERYLQLEMAARGESVEEDIDSLISKFHARITGYLFGEERPKDDWMFTMIWGRRPEIASWIWATSRAQQIFLLMHEYGHIAAGTGTHDKVTRGVFRHHFVGHDEEFKADRWAAIKIANGMRVLFPKDPSIIATGIFLLFEYLELLRKTGIYILGDEYPGPRERFEKIEGILNPSAQLIARETLEGKRENFDMLYQAYSVSQRNHSKRKKR